MTRVNQAERLRLALAVVVILLLSLATAADATSAPPNDDFAAASLVDALPYSDTVDLTGATSQAGEPAPPCAPGLVAAESVWYAYTPTATDSLYASITWSTYYGPQFLAVYSGEWGSLTAHGCWMHSGGAPVAFRAEQGVTYYFQVGNVEPHGGPITFSLEVAPPMTADFFYGPEDPSALDVIQFQTGCQDPIWAPANQSQWDFGDGTTAEGPWPTHQYAADGDYTVTIFCSAVDGRSATASKVIAVRTHEVALTRIDTPRAAMVGQTRQISVGVKNLRYDETVQVDFYRSNEYGWDWVGAVTQFVPGSRNARPVNVAIDYTFTAADASLGKVNFYAYATLIGARDALEGDNIRRSAYVLVMP